MPATGAVGVTSDGGEVAAVVCFSAVAQPPHNASKLDTPVIGLVTEDVWHNGELVIPAGTEVQGRASLDRARERIAA